MDNLKCFWHMTGSFGVFGGHFGPLFQLSGDPIQNIVDFWKKSKIPVLPSYDWGMTLMTWHCNSIKVWKNLNPYNQIFIMKEFISFVIFLDLQAKSVRSWNNSERSSEIPFSFQNRFSTLDDKKSICSLKISLLIFAKYMLKKSLNEK